MLLLVIFLVMYSAIVLILTPSSGYLRWDQIQDLTNGAAFAQPLPPDDTTKLGSLVNDSIVECRDEKNGFSIKYNKSWYRSPDSCVYFGPKFDIFSDNKIEPFVRITVTNVSNSNTTLEDVLKVVLSWTPSQYPGAFELIRTPGINNPGGYTLNGSAGFSVFYAWKKSILAGLPYVDQKSTSSFMPVRELREELIPSSQPASSSPGYYTPSTSTPTPHPPLSREQGETQDGQMLIQTGQTVNQTQPKTEIASSPQQSQPSLVQINQTGNQTEGQSNSESSFTQAGQTVNQTQPKTESESPEPTSNLLSRLLAVYEFDNGKVYIFEPSSLQTGKTVNQTQPETKPNQPGTEPTSQNPSSALNARLLAIYTVHDGKVYVIEYGSPSREFEKYSSMVLDMIKSFEFTK